MISSFIIIPRFSRVRTSQGRAMNKNTSLGPSRKEQHQNCSTIRADLASPSHDIPGGRRKKGSSSHQSVCVGKRYTNTKTLIWEAFRLSRRWRFGVDFGAYPQRTAKSEV